MSSDKKRLSAKVFLLKEMVVRDLRSRYAGSGLGLAWVVLHPILWMVLYSAVFSVILRVPVDGEYAGFPEFLMAGLLPWMAIQEGISRSASALPDNAMMVKKAVFPIETLVLSAVLAAVVNQLVAFLVFAVYLFFIGHLSIWILLAVPALALQILLTYGIGCLAATVTAFVRDAGHAIGILLTVVFFATPIVYPASMVPARFRPILDANPVAHLVGWYRAAFTLHELPPAGSVLSLTAFAAVAALLGGLLFLRARPHFADLV
ncbi:MAG TPA: ABC transporter permease [Thermoanaerobaculia bacterium]|nr:ABC transporter permease [Thermoanaerobaculia bacterium]